MTEKEQILSKINQIVSGNQLNEDQFRSIVDSLVRKGGKEAEALMGKLILQTDFPMETRIKIVLTAGDLQNPLLMAPLKSVLDNEPNMHLKKAAIVAISQFNNQKALNLLNSTLQVTANPYLKGALVERIDHIKKNNPILGLLPRFLKGEKDKKAFLVSLDLLKKTMTNADTGTFVPYLKDEDLLVQRGTFELLCTHGDRTLQSEIFCFFFEKAENMNLDNQNDIDYFFVLIVNLRDYISRFPALLFSQVGKLKLLYPKMNEPRIQRVFISIFCHCRSLEAIAFVKEIYESGSQEIKDIIAEEASENDNAMDFLVDKYKSGATLKEKVLKAFLKSPKGYQFFTEQFDSFDPKVQEMIVKSLPDSLQPQIIGFIQTLFKSDLQHLKKILLSKIRINFLYTFKDILFDKDRQAELFELDDDYLATITQLFPVLSIRHLMARAIIEDKGAAKLKDYVGRILEITNHEAVIHFKDYDLLNQFANKIIMANSSSLNQMYLSILEKIKTFDQPTYKGLYESLNHYCDARDAQMSEEEIHAVKRVKENYKNIVDDVKKIEALDKELKHAFLKATPDFNQLRKALDTYHIGIAFKTKWFMHFIADHFKKTADSSMSSWREFFKDLPIITQLVKEASINADETGMESYYDKLRIVIRFQENFQIALFKDQFAEIIPNFKIITDASPLEPTDILVCDGYYLKEYMNAKALNAKRIFTYLENRADYAAFKSVNMKAFFPPFSSYRILKFILQELYALKPS